MNLYVCFYLRKVVINDYSSSQVLFTDGSKTALGSNMSKNGTQRII